MSANVVFPVPGVPVTRILGSLGICLVNKKQTGKSGTERHDEAMVQHKGVGLLHKMILQPISDGIGVLRKEVSIPADSHFVRPRAHSAIQVTKTNGSIFRSKRIRFKFLTRTQLVLLDILLREKTAVVPIRNGIGMLRRQVSVPTHSSAAHPAAPTHHNSLRCGHAGIHELKAQLCSGLCVRIGFSWRHRRAISICLLLGSLFGVSTLR